MIIIEKERMNSMNFGKIMIILEMKLKIKFMMILIKIYKI